MRMFDGSQNFKSTSSPYVDVHKQKRRLSGLEDNSELSTTAHRSKRRRNASESPAAFIRPPPLSFPKSAYLGNEPSLPPASEKVVLDQITASEETSSTISESNTFLEVDVYDFSIYRKHKSRGGKGDNGPGEASGSNELVSLHEIDERNVEYFLIDGLISDGDTRWYVEKVPFKNLSIGGYLDPSFSTVESQIWIQSFQGKKSDVWYHLRKPAPEYQRYHDTFLWMANLAKYVTEFFSTLEDVVLDDFRDRFHRSLLHLYPTDPCLHTWFDAYPSEDFRAVIISQANFLWCQASQIDKKSERYSLWEEIALRAVPEQIELNVDDEMLALSQEGIEKILRRKTTVTPYVYECFRHMPWAKFLYSQSPSVKMMALSRKNLSSSAPISRKKKSETRVGDIVALPLDKETTWKGDDKEWYGYVQNVTETSQGRQLGLLWLYRPSDTECLKMFYPYERELFMSDHCNCGDAPTYAEEVIHHPRVALFSGPEVEDIDFFVRQKYIQADGAWETLRPADLKCSCNKASNERDLFIVGDTLLARIKDTLEPVILMENPRNSTDSLKVRRMLRMHKISGTANIEPNELGFTNHLMLVSRADLERRCQIRFYTEVERQQHKIPAPYNRQGTGDFFYVISRDFEFGPEPLTNPWPPINEGWDPLAISIPLMRGLDLFCGGGSLGRGLEEGGAVELHWAVDWDKEAIHTYRANRPEGCKSKLYFGSVNDYLTQAMQGQGLGLVAQFGEVQFISAGSPCQGFSLANPLKGNEPGILNESMVASVAASVDFYRPDYAIMENVKGMAVGGEHKNVLAQVICAFAGMGYQVRVFCSDAWSYGSPQSRTRILISVAAPGLVPLPEPPQTHSHPENIRAGSLGKTANGLSMGSRYSSYTPFPYASAADSVKDLPNTDARTACIQFPDHRMSRPLSTLDRIRISSIPRFPGGSTFVRAVKAGRMPQPQVNAYNWESKIRSSDSSRAWQRVRRNRLMPTVLTAAKPDDGTCGTCVHWDDDRLLTVMEVRRGQGIPDNEVLLGSPLQQWKIVGNGVARQVALAFGLSLRHAWTANNDALKPDLATDNKAIPTQTKKSLESEATSTSGVSWHINSVAQKLKALITNPDTPTSFSNSKRIASTNDDDCGSTHPSRTSSGTSVTGTDLDHEGQSSAVLANRIRRASRVGASEDTPLATTPSRRIVTTTKTTTSKTIIRKTIVVLDEPS